MKLLLDTHVFLWFASGHERLKGRVLGLISDPKNRVYVSIVSAWEAAIKFKNGKLKVVHSTPHDYFGVRRENLGIDLLSLDHSSLQRLQGLPMIHKDPFDQMLICQALEHDLTLVTADKDILRYPVPTLSC